MIFVTVGHQMPFDRLVSIVDEWAGERGRIDVFAQIGDTGLRPRHIEHAARISPTEFIRRVGESRCIVGHAGMGTILTALRHERPVLVMPRLATLRETRNEHQLATARRLAGRPGVEVAFDEAALRSRLDRLDELTSADAIPSHANPSLIAAVRAFVAGQPWPDARECVDSPSSTASKRGWGLSLPSSR